YRRPCIQRPAHRMVGRGRLRASARHRRPLVVLNARHRNCETAVLRGTGGSKPAQMAVPTEWALSSWRLTLRRGVPEGLVAATVRHRPRTEDVARIVRSRP